MALIKCGKRIKVLYYLHPRLGRGREGREVVGYQYCYRWALLQSSPGSKPCTWSKSPAHAGGVGAGSVAAAGLHHHVAVLLEDHVVVAVVVEDRGGAEFGGRAARLGHGLGLHQVDLGGEEP